MCLGETMGDGRGCPHPDGQLGIGEFRLLASGADTLELTLESFATFDS